MAIKRARLVSIKLSYTSSRWALHTDSAALMWWRSKLKAWGVLVSIHLSD